jgi:ferredoxin
LQLFKVNLLSLKFLKENCLYEYMAILKVGGTTKEVKDGDLIKDAAEALGIPFSCKEGVCGSCLCNVLKGKENLAPLSQPEKDYGLDEGGTQRLCCQTKVNGGEVEVESGY